MKIKLSRLILSVSVIGVILMGISLVNIYKTDIVVKDVHGERTALGDMNILIQKTGGVFETDEIIIDKNGEKTSKLVKQGSKLFNLTEKNIDNRDVFQFEHDRNILFEDEDSIGMANILAGEIIDNNWRMAADIKIKDKKNGKIESYEIDMGDSIYTEKNYKYAAIPVKKEGDILHVAVMYSYYNYPSDEEYSDDLELESKYCKTTNLSLYKLNLSNKTSKCIISQDYEGKDLSLKNAAFSNENKAYFVVDKKNDKSNTYKTNLFEFDVKTKDVNLIETGTKEDYITKSCTIEDGEILLISTPISGALSNEDTKAILLDLKNKNIKYTYKLDMNYKVSPIYTDRIRRYNEKIYVVSSEYTDMENYEDSYNTSYKFYVFDEKNGEKLYEGSVEINSSYRVNMGIVKDDEIS